jgi:CBS domain-containing protein
MQARDIMTPDVICVAPDTGVAEVVRLMLDRRISAVPVVEEGRLVGIVSEGDLLRRVETGTDAPPSRWLELVHSGDTRAADYVKTHGRRAEEVMTRSVITVGEDASLAQIARILAAHRFRRVPVMRGERLVGIVSRANLMQALASRMAAPAEAPSADDRRIREALLAEIGRQSWAAPGDASVTVSNGVVHLWGSIDSEAKHRALVVTAENIPGVAAVEDHMQRLVAVDPVDRPNWPTPGRP